MLKDDEAEDAYWEGMRNTNHAAGNRLATKDGWKADLQREEEEAEGGAELTGALARMTVNSRAAQLGGAASNKYANASTVSSNSGAPAAKAPATQQQYVPKTTTANPPHQQQHQQQKAGQHGNKPTAAKDHTSKAEGTTVNADGTSSAPKKPRNKTFDKHHQKDKAIRKFGSFAPV